MAKKTPAPKTDDTDDLLGTPAVKTPAVKKAAPAVKKTTAKAADADADDLLGTSTKKTSKKAAAAAPEPKEKKTKAPVHFAEGERQAMYDAIAAIFKPAKAKPMSSKDLAAKLAEQLPKADITVRKLRPVLYAMAKKEGALINLELGASKVLGLTVSRAA